jgi:hypothetical protein
MNKLVSSKYTAILKWSSLLIVVLDYTQQRLFVTWLLTKKSVAWRITVARQEQPSS